MRTPIHAVLAAALVFPSLTTAAAPPAFPEVSQLPSRPELPDLLVMLDGTKVASKGDWFEKRRPELKALFEHYMYGTAPPAPTKVTASVEREDRNYLKGKATKKDV